MMLSGTLAGWVNVMILMLLPALITLIPRLKQPSGASDETLSLA